MRSLDVLIQLAQREADMRRGLLAEAALAKTDADAALIDYDTYFAGEMRLGADDPVVMASAGAWAGHARRARIALDARRRGAERDESAARDDLRSAFIDLKRLEVARDHDIRRERKAARMQAAMRAEEAYLLSRTFADA